MSDTLLAGQIGRLATATSVTGASDYVPVYQGGVLKKATPDMIALGQDAVIGPSSATDNAIARFDGTTGEIIQNSVVTIADSNGNMAGVGTLGCGAITSTGAITGTRFIDSTAISTASTSTTMSATGASLVGSASATTFPLAKPDVGCFKYIRCTNATTSRKIKVSVAAASGTINNSKTVITFSNIGDSVTLFGETSTRWGICGSFVAGTTRIATS